MPADASHPDQPPTRVVELCVNLDDVTGQLVADAIETLLREGALDAWAVPIVMKKGRPALMLSALVEDAQRDGFAARVLELTGSMGVRYRAWERRVLERGHVEVGTMYGRVRLKVGRLDGRVVVARPEHDDVRALAAAAGVDVRAAREQADAAAAAFLTSQRSRTPLTEQDD